MGADPQEHPFMAKAKGWFNTGGPAFVLCWGVLNLPGGWGVDVEAMSWS
jgi:hypothetical protein